MCEEEIKIGAESVVQDVSNYIKVKKEELSKELSQALIHKDKTKEATIEKCMDILDEIEVLL